MIVETVTAIRNRLISTASVTDLVPASAIVDANERPALDRTIILGPCQIVDDGALDRSRARIYVTAHVWDKSPSLELVHRIAMAVRFALHAAPLEVTEGRILDLFVSDVRTLRDGAHSHAILAISALVSTT